MDERLRKSAVNSIFPTETRGICCTYVLEYKDKRSINVENNKSKASVEERERRVIAYICGDAEPPAKIKPLVQWYREYSMLRAECVSYPKWQDDRANKVYDGLVASV